MYPTIVFIAISICFLAFRRYTRGIRKHHIPLGMNEIQGNAGHEDGSKNMEQHWCGGTENGLSSWSMRLEKD